MGDSREVPKGVYEHKRGVYHHSSETKRKIGKANSVALLGKVPSEETREKRSVSLVRAYAEGRHARQTWLIGIPRDPETKKKISKF